MFSRKFEGRHLRARRFWSILVVPLVCISCAESPEPVSGSPHAPNSPATSLGNSLPDHGVDPEPHATAGPETEITAVPKHRSNAAIPEEDIDTALQSVLPAGARLIGSGLDSDSGSGIEGMDLTFQAYEWDGRPGMAVVNSDPTELRWDLNRDLELDRPPDAVWPLRIRGATMAAVIQSKAGDSLLVFHAEDRDLLVMHLRLPDLDVDHIVEAGRPSIDGTLYHEMDFSGDGLEDPIVQLAEGGPLLLYEAEAGQDPRMAHIATYRSVLLRRGSGSPPMLIEPSGSNSWTRSTWQNGRFEVIDVLDPPLPPEPIAIKDGTLPELPGQLSWISHREQALNRWAREGGSIHTLWQDRSGEIAIRGLKVSQDGSAMLLATTAPEAMRSDHVELALVRADGTETALPTHGSLRGYDLSSDGRRATYVGLGVDGEGKPLAIKDGIPAIERGTIFGIDLDDPEDARPLAPCEAEMVHSWWTVGCLGDVRLDPDGQEAAFADVRGLWLAPWDGSEPRQLIEQFYVEDDGPGSRIYAPDRWSPDGSRLLARVGGYEGTSPVVLDRRDGTLRNVPDAWTYGYSSELAWSADGAKLLVTRLGPPGERASSLRLVDAADPTRDLPLLNVVLTDAHRYRTLGPAIAPDGSLRFALWSRVEGMWPPNGIYRSSSDGSSLKMLASLPSLSGAGSDPTQVPGRLLWSAAADAFVFQFEAEGEHRALVGLEDGGALWDVSELLARAEWIAWSD